MNKKKILISCLLLFLFQVQHIETSVSSELPNNVFSDLSFFSNYEKLIYKAKFLGLSIGTFTITNNGKMMLNGQEVYCFELKARTLPFFSIIFKPKDQYVSYMSTQEFVVMRHEEYIKEGTVLESAVDFDYQNLTATYKNFITHEEKTVKIPDKVWDILSGGFYLRMIPLELGDAIELNIYADQQIFNYKGELSSKTKVSVPNYGKQDAYYFKPSLFLDGKQLKKISAAVFFSTTTPMKTLRATLKTRFGSVHVVLVEDESVERESF